MDEDDIAKQPPRRAPVARRGWVNPEIWQQAIADYLGGATATEVARRYGVARHSIYSRLSGKGKKARWRAAASCGDGAEAPLSLEGRGVGGEGDASRTQENEATCGGAHAALNDAPADQRVSPHPLPPPPLGEGEQRRIRIRRHHAQEIWLQARADYEVGHHTARAIAENYGMTEDAIRRRARVERIRAL